MSSLLLVICSASVAIYYWQVLDASSRGSVTSDVSCSDVAPVVSVWFVCCVRRVPFSMSWFRSIGCSLILSLFCVVSIICSLLSVVLSAGCNLSKFLIFLRRFWGSWLQSRLCYWRYGGLCGLPLSAGACWIYMSSVTAAITCGELCII
jgi:hypothetical protein